MRDESELIKISNVLKISPTYLKRQGIEVIQLEELRLECELRSKQKFLLQK